MKILISDSAYQDFEQIRNYYTDEGASHVGDNFVVSIIKHLESLADNPKIGRKVPEFDVETIRELIHSPFRIIYLIEKKSIHVVLIWRSERLLKIENISENDDKA